MLRSIIDLFRPSSTIAQPAAGDTAETSMNFDGENVRPFLESPKPGTVDPAVIATVDQAVNTMAVGETRDFVINAQTGLQLQIFMDDFQAPDLYFFGSQEVIQYIDQSLIAFANASEL